MFKVLPLCVSFANYDQLVWSSQPLIPHILFSISHILCGLLILNIYFNNKDKSITQDSQYLWKLFRIYLIRSVSYFILTGQFNNTFIAIVGKLFNIIGIKSSLFRPSFSFIFTNYFVQDVLSNPIDISVIHNISSIGICITFVIITIVFLIDLRSTDDKIQIFNLQPSKFMTITFCIVCLVIIASVYGSLLNFISITIFITFCNLYCLIGYMKVITIRRIAFKKISNPVILILTFVIIMMIMKKFAQQETIVIVQACYTIIGIVLSFVDKQKLEKILP